MRHVFAPAPLRGGRRAQRPGGQALVEFALIFPVVGLLLLGVFDFGRLYADQVAVTSAAREGARDAMHAPDNTNDAGVRAVVVQALNGAVTLANNPPTSADIAITAPADRIATGQIVVTVNYTHDLLVGLMPSSTLNMVASATMPYVP
jgi:Flp pilus assembly protein TadG